MVAIVVEMADGGVREDGASVVAVVVVVVVELWMCSRLNAMVGFSRQTSKAGECATDTQSSVSACVCVCVSGEGKGRSARCRGMRPLGPL